MFTARITNHSTRTGKIQLNAKTVEGARREAGKWLSEFGRDHTVTVYGDGFEFAKTHGSKWSEPTPSGNETY